MGRDRLVGRVAGGKEGGRCTRADGGEINGNFIDGEGSAGC